MGVDEDRKKNYAINEQIITSGTVDSNEKYAWCSRATTFQHLCSNVSTVKREAFLGQHFNKLSYEHRTDLLQRRANAVDTYVETFKKPAKTQTTSDTPDIEISHSKGIKNRYADARCAGRYQRNQYNEMNENALRKFQTVEESKDCSSINPTMLENKLISKNHVESAIIASPGKNTLSAFLTPKPQSRNSQEKEVNANAIDYSNNAKQKDQQPLKSTEPNHKNLLTFRTAHEELMMQNMKKNNNPSNRGKSYYQTETPLFNYASTKKSLGARRAVNSNFVLPLRTDDSRSATITTTITSGGLTMNGVSPMLSHTLTSTPPEAIAPIDARLANIDPKMVELITNEIMHKNQSVDWNDIAGLDYAKSIIKEAVVYPLLRPDIFTGLRRPPRGILLFGPPGTGKTLIGKCIASKSKSTFFSISASSLTSKWVGDGEKMVRALFAVAAVHQPSVVFIDEIDSLLSQRSENEHESSRRLKTEFLVQLDGAATSDDDRILIVGATNRPHELDEAARRRLVRRLYIPLPEIEARTQILANLLKTVRNNLTSEEIRKIGELTEGYSGSDMESLCREAAMEPIRSIPADEILVFKVENVRPIIIEDFRVALHNVRPSVSPNDLTQYEDWNRIYGAGK